MPQRKRHNRFLFGLLALSLLAVVALTAGSAQAASGPGPYYAKPAWDRKLPALTRFLVLTNWNNEAVLDKETGLVWERSPAITTHTWAAARSECTGRTTGNRKGWRLPSVHELQSLIHPSVAPPGPLLQPGHPFVAVQGADYWSASSLADDPTLAWSVGFGLGLLFRDNKSFGSQVWCVRGGMQAEAY